MKKTLLALAASVFTMWASAATYELSAKDATDLVGTVTEERPAGTTGDKDYGEAKHVQPLESLKIGDFSFSFSKATGSTDPAYYYAMSTNENGIPNIRVYKNNEMTITGPADMKITAVSCTGTKVDKVAFTCDGTNVVKFTNATGENVRFNTITIYTDGTTPEPTPDPDPTPDPEPAVDGYTIFDISTPSSWTGDSNGWTSSVTVDGKAFTITSAKAESSSDLISPVANTYSWRVYKNSEFTIESKDIDMITVVITYDDFNGGVYCLEMNLSEGWTGTLSGATYTLTSAGTKTLTCSAVNGQTRIKKIVVSDKDGASIKNIEASEEGTMVIYNLRGQRLSAPQKGINIINGKKVIF